MVEGNPVDIVDCDWDVLVILDACRYDFFAELYHAVFGEMGCLKKAVSPATHTPEFLFKAFGSHGFLQDVIYVSANVYVNSKRVPLPKTSYGFDVRSCFKKIVDVWKIGWDEKLGTVHPKEINKHAVVSMSVNKGFRFIIHYVQPHEPYICYGGGQGSEGYQKSIRVKWQMKINRLLHRVVTDEKTWSIANRLGLLPERGKGKIWVEYGREGIIRGYRENLKLVLCYVRRLIDLFPKKKFLVTADHGELLGENGNYGHMATYARCKELSEVPWFEIKGDSGG